MPNIILFRDLEVFSTNVVLMLWFVTLNTFIRIINIVYLRIIINLT